MSRRTSARLLSAAAITAAGIAYGSAALAADAAAGAAVNPEAPPPPQAELLPGVDLYNDDDRLLGTIQRVETRNGQQVAIVSVGNEWNWFTADTVAVPVNRIYVDGKKIRVRMSQSAFRNRAS